MSGEVVLICVLFGLGVLGVAPAFIGNMVDRVGDWFQATWKRLGLLYALGAFGVICIVTGGILTNQLFHQMALSHP
jgi:hypothetical protein